MVHMLEVLQHAATFVVRQETDVNDGKTLRRRQRCRSAEEVTSQIASTQHHCSRKWPFGTQKAPKPLHANCSGSRGLSVDMVLLQFCVEIVIDPPAVAGFWWKMLCHDKQLSARRN